MRPNRTRTLSLASIVLSALLLITLSIPAATSLFAAAQVIRLAPGDQITIECETRLRGRVRNTSTTLACDPLPTTTTPTPASATATAAPATATPVPPTATAVGQETPVAGQLCPAWVHDRHVTTGPDGKAYPTWHPPVDPEYGCLFGHEHGADPRTSKADASMPAFGYAAALMGMAEPHVGFKVFVFNAGEIADDGARIPADFRIVFHMGTGGVKRYTERFHSLEYDYVARDGSGRFAHIYGMSDTTANPIGSTCSNPRRGGRDFSTIGCNDPYEIWPFLFSIIHPSDPYTDPMHVRAYVSGAVAAFDPITTVDPSDLTRLVFTQDYRRPGSGVDPRSPDADFLGCQREAYGGPNYWNNQGKPTVYYTDAMGVVQPGPGPNVIRQEISAVNNTNNAQFKYRQDFCGGGIRWPN